VARTSHYEPARNFTIRLRECSRSACWHLTLRAENLVISGLMIICNASSALFISLHTCSILTRDSLSLSLFRALFRVHTLALFRASFSELSPRTQRTASLALLFQTHLHRFNCSAKVSESLFSLRVSGRYR
jgi:hypothetical protein